MTKSYDEKLATMRNWILTKIEERGPSREVALYRDVDGERRHLFDPALDQLVDSGVVTISEEGVIAFAGVTTTKTARVSKKRDSAVAEPAPMPLRGPYTPEQAAPMFGPHVTPDWLLRRLRAGKLPGHKIGREWVFTDEDIAEGLELFAVKPIAVNSDPAGLSSRSRTHLRNRRVRS